MLRIVFLLLLSCALPLQAALLPGSVAPAFTLPAAQAGQATEVSLADLLQRGPVVLWFYPKAFTGGCTLEANAFAGAIPEFTALGATVVGVSADGLEVLKDFSVKECRNAFAVASDTEGKVIQAYGARLLPGVATAKRITYVITPDGKVFYVWAAMGAKEHLDKALAAVKAWKNGQPAPQD